MLEILAFFIFTKKIKTIAQEKGIEAKPWIWKLVLRWLSLDIGIMVLIMLVFKISIEDEAFILASIPAILLALLSAFYTMKQLKEVESENNELEEEKKEQNFDHFR